MMEISNTKETVNDLLGRKEISGELSFTGATPSYADFSKFVAQKFSVPEDTVVVKNIFTKFGATKADFVVFVYKSVTEKNTFEPKVKAKKAGAAEGKEAAKA